MGEVVGNGEFVDLLDCVVEVGCDLGEIIAVVVVEVYEGFN